MPRRPNQCAFCEPWRGYCNNTVAVDGDVCDEHKQAHFICVNCGKQAVTKCQASMGLMCGNPLCEECDKAGGGCCKHHSTR